MQTLFNQADRDAVMRRLDALQPSNMRQWGKMDAGQMLAHCAVALEVPCGDVVKRQAFIGRVLSPFVRSSVLGEKPFGHDSPTDPAFRIVDTREFAVEKKRLAALVDRFCARSRPEIDGTVHSFFGRLNADEWGRLMYKHLDHHLRQFNA